MRCSRTQTKVSLKVSETVQVRYLCHVMRQAESSRDMVQQRNYNTIDVTKFYYFTFVIHFLLLIAACYLLGKDLYFSYIG